MKQVRSLFLGATIAAATVTAVSFAPSAAQAVSLRGDVTITGDLRITNTGPGNVNRLLDFFRVDSINTTPVFDQFLPILNVPRQDTVIPYLGLNNSKVDIKDLTLVPEGRTNYYKLSKSYVPFIDFGQRTLNGKIGNLTFDLLEAIFIVGRNNNSFGTFEEGVGYWNFEGKTIALASISGSRASTLSAYTISITAVPEPLTIGGLALGTGFGAFLKTRYAKKEKQLEKA